MHLDKIPQYDIFIVIIIIILRLFWSDQGFSDDSLANKIMLIKSLLRNGKTKRP